LLFAALATEQDIVLGTLDGREGSRRTAGPGLGAALGGVQLLGTVLRTQLGTTLLGLIPSVAGIAGAALHVDALAIGTSVAHLADWGTIGTHTIASRLQLSVAIATGTGVGRYALGTHRTLGLTDGLTVVAAILVTSGRNVAGNTLATIWSGTAGMGRTAASADGFTQSGFHLQIARAALPDQLVGHLLLHRVMQLDYLLWFFPNFPFGLGFYDDHLLGDRH